MPCVIQHGNLWSEIRPPYQDTSNLPIFNTEHIQGEQDEAIKPTMASVCLMGSMKIIES